MSTVVDNRVVDMEFNNRQFEDGVQTSIRSLDALKKGLNLDESAKSLTNLSNAGHRFNLSGLLGIGEGVQNISSKFNALGAIGFTVFQNLTNGAMGFAKQMLENVTGFRTAMQGLSEYETQINAIQTIMANTQSKGTTLDQVNKSLAELNAYADKTIYSFPEMTRNIGTFTAAGVGLETSVAAIKGIANLAAVSGSNSQQASTAMYQLSQALASGTVKLMDWNSVVNAGMGGQVFQDSLKETARLHKVNIDGMIKEEGSFRETLQKGWLTSEILTETLAKFTGDLNEQQLKTMGYTDEQIKNIVRLGQTANDAATKVKTFTQLKDTLMESITSGWAQSWQIVLGDFEEVKSFFTEINATLGGFISASSDARNKVLKDWKKFGGRVDLLEAVRNAFKAIEAAVKPVQEAFKEIFPPMTGYQLRLLTAGLKDLLAKLVMTPETADKVKRVFKGLFAAIDIVRQVIVTVASGLGKLLGTTGPAASGILDFLARIGDYIVTFRDGLNVTEDFGKGLDKVKTIFGNVKTAITKFVDVVSSKFEEFKTKFSDAFGEGFKKIDTRGVGEFFEKFHIRFEPLTKLVEVMGRIFSGLGKLIQKFAPLFFKIGGALAEFLGNLGTSIYEGLMNLDFSKLFDTINGGLFAALLLAIRNFVSNGSGALGEVKGIFGGVKEVLDGVKGSLEAWQQSLKAKVLLTIALAIAILAASLIALSMVDSGKLTVAIAAITTMFLELSQAMSYFSKLSSGKSSQELSFVAGLIGISLAVLILAGALKMIAGIEAGDMVKGLLAIEALMLMLGSFSKVMSQNSKDLIKGALGLILFGLALKLIVDVVKELGAIKMDELKQGLIGVGVVLAELALFLKVTDLSGGGIRKSVGLIILAGAIMILSSAVEKFGKMDPAALEQGLLSIGAVLAGIAVFVNTTGDSKSVIATSIGITILAAAMLIFAQAVTAFGNMSWEQLGRGLIGMAGALIIVFAAVKLFPKGAIKTGIGLLIIAAALVVLSEALKTMGSMTWEEIARGLVALAGSFIIIAAAMYAMQGALPGAAALLVVAFALSIFVPSLKSLGEMSLQQIGIGLLALAASFVILGLAGALLTPVIPSLLGLAGAIALFGVGIALVGAGILAFSLGLTALAAAGAAGAVGLVAFFSAILSLIPMVVTVVVKAIIQFAKLIAEAAPEIAKALEVTLLALIGVIVAVTPPLVDAAVLLILKLLDGIQKTLPKVIETVMLLIETILTTLANNMQKFVDAGMKILLGFLRGIRDNIGQVVSTALEIVAKFIEGIASKIGDVVDAGVKLIVAFINGIADAIDENSEALNAAISRLVTALIDGLVSGILAGTGAVAEAIWKLLQNGIIGAVSGGLEINSPSKVTRRFGQAVDEGLILGIKDLSREVYKTSEKLANTAVGTMSEAISTVLDVLNTNMDSQPTIRPVIDLTDVVSGGRQIDNILGSKSLSLATTMARLPYVPGKYETSAINEAAKEVPAAQQVISLTQNNYSPKALSAIEIYRQTRNQLNTLKGLVENT